MAEFPERLRAFIWIPDGVEDVEDWRRRCLEHVERMGYLLEGIAVDGGEATMRELSRLVAEGLVDVFVSTDRSHLRRDLTPRVEFVAEAPVLPRQTRPGLVVRRRHRAPGDQA